MFAYNPTVNDRSGEILGAGQMQAAQTNAQMLQGIGDDIGGAIASLGKSYAAAKADAAELEGYDEVFKMHAPQMGVGGEDLDRFLKMPNQQRRAAYTSLYENYMPHQQRMEYLKTQASSFGNRGPGAGGGGGAGGGQGAFYTVQ
jgi:hypothetical protein